MKRSVVFAGFLFSQSLFGGEETHALWLELSAKCQNVAHGLNGVGPHTDPETLQFGPSLLRIDLLLDRLVEEKELVRQEFKLKNPSEWPGEAGPELIETVKTLAEKYGFFVASEMLDVGFRLELDPIKEGEPFLMVVRVPKELGKDFNDFVGKYKLQVEDE